MNNINRLLEYVEELGKIPMATIEDVAGTIKILNGHGYTCHLSPDTNYLIVEEVDE